MAILVLELLDEIRDILDDKATDANGTPPPAGFYANWQASDVGLLWNNRTLIRNLNWTIQEIGMRDPALDADNTTYCRIAVLAGNRYYSPNPLILTIEDVRFGNTVLEKTLLASLEYRHGESLWSQRGTPTHYYEDADANQIVLFPTPATNGFLSLVVRRRFASDVEWVDIASESEPSTELNEVPDSYRKAIINGVLSRCYMKRDADIVGANSNSLTLSQYHDAEFTKAVGPPVTLRELRMRREGANLTISLRGPDYFKAVARERER